MSEGRRGFTLIELMLVLLIMAVAGALVLPRLGRGIKEEAVNSWAKNIISYLNAVHVRAMEDGQTLVVAIDRAEGKIRTEGNEPLVIPSDLEVMCARKEIVFYGDGTSTGGNIQLSAKGHGGLSILVNPFSGLARISEYGEGQ